MHERGKGKTERCLLVMFVVNCGAFILQRKHRLKKGKEGIRRIDCEEINEICFVEIEAKSGGKWWGILFEIIKDRYQYLILMLNSITVREKQPHEFNLLAPCLYPLSMRKKVIH